MEPEPQQSAQEVTQNILTDASAGEEMKEFLLFELDGALYAMTLESVDQVMRVPPITTVPNAPDSILGIFHLRGKVVVVIDLLKRMHLVRAKPFVPSYLFVIHREKDYFAVLIDHAKTVVRIPVHDIHEADPVVAAHVPPRYARGMFLYVEPPKHSARMPLPNIMIEPKSEQENIPASSPVRPVLWLSIEELLNQEDLLGILPMVEKGEEHPG